MTTAEIGKILEEARSHGLAFVTDEFTETSDGEEVYNPEVNYPEAESWLQELLLAL